MPKFEHSNYVTERSDTEPRPKPEGHSDLSDRWVGAGHLKVGDKLKQADGTLGEVKYVNTIQEARTMYNLEVQEAHTFFVGTQGWLVHNCPDGDEVFETIKNGLFPLHNNGIKSMNEVGKDLKWGSGEIGAQQRLDSLNEIPEEYFQELLTKGYTEAYFRALGNSYKKAVERVRGDKTAPIRVKLMEEYADRIAKAKGGK